MDKISALELCFQRDELEHFINTVRNNTPATVSSSDGRRAIMVAGKIAEEIAANAALRE